MKTIVLAVLLCIAAPVAAIASTIETFRWTAVIQGGGFNGQTPDPLNLNLSGTIELETVNTGRLLIRGTGNFTFDPFSINVDGTDYSPSNATVIFEALDDVNFPAANAQLVLGQRLLFNEDGVSAIYRREGTFSSIDDLLTPIAPVNLFLPSDMFPDANVPMSSESVFTLSRIAPIPLPAAAWMLLGGVGLLTAVGRRRR